MKKFLIGLVIVFVIVAIGLVVYYQQKMSVTACTKEAKVCPDGSAVGRQGPNCEFAECPVAQAVDETADWKTYTNNKYGYEISYPSNWSISENNNSLSHNLILGNPLAGEQVYSLDLLVLTNKKNQTSRQLAEMEIKEGENMKEVMIAGQLVYGRNNVSEIDQHSEILYLVNNGYMYTFRFPISEENLNLANPAENNKIAHKIISTFKFTK